MHDRDRASSPHTVTGKITRGRGAVDSRHVVRWSGCWSGRTTDVGGKAAERRWWAPRRRGRRRQGPHRRAHLGAPQWVPPVGASCLPVIQFLSIGLYAE